MQQDKKNRKIFGLFSGGGHSQLLNSRTNTKSRVNVSENRKTRSIRAFYDDELLGRPLNNVCSDVR